MFDTVHSAGLNKARYVSNCIDGGHYDQTCVVHAYSRHQHESSAMRCGCNGK